MAVIHVPQSTYELEDAYKLLEIPYVLYEGDDPQILKKFLRDSGSLCGISIGGGTLDPYSSAPEVPLEILDFPLPKIGICLGHEILGEHLGSRIVPCNPPVGEQGESLAKFYPNLLFRGLDLSQEYPVRMAHRRMLESLPVESELISSTNLTPVSGFFSPKKRIWGLQFHPEKDWMNTLVFENFYSYCLTEI